MSESVSVEEMLLQLSRRAAAMERADMAHERAMAAQIEETATAAAVVEETTTVDPAIQVLADDTVAAVLTGSSNSGAAAMAARPGSAAVVEQVKKSYTTRSPITRKAYVMRALMRPDVRASVATTTTTARPETFTAAVAETTAAVEESPEATASEVVEAIPEADPMVGRLVLDDLARVAKATAVETAVTFSEELAAASAGADSTEDAVLQAAERTVEVIMRVERAI